jgi:hypothetical protein
MISVVRCNNVFLAGEKGMNTNSLSVATSNGCWNSLSRKIRLG